MNTWMTKAPAIDIGIGVGDPAGCSLDDCGTQRNRIPVAHHVNVRESVRENVGSGDVVLVRVGLDGRYISHRLISSPGRRQPVSP